jgi:hypothetical protein
MVLDPKKVPTRGKLILAGLYLSKYDTAGLKRLGFESFGEAYNVVGYALGARPASIKNYRDEFDPLVSKRRKGWHKRPTREYCLRVFEDYKGLDFDTFTALIQSFSGLDENILSELTSKDRGKETVSFFAKRLITGLAAERYFESVQPQISAFKEYSVEDTTGLGCGYDFRLNSISRRDFFAVEVKGLSDTTGSVSLTPKEFQVASVMTDRFFLFVVKNFRESPYHEIFRNPLSGDLHFTRKERVLVHVSWLTAV